MKIPYFLLWFVLVFSLACNEQSPIVNLEPKDFKEKIEDDKDKQLLDVRTSDECALGIISGAENVDILSHDFTSKVEKLHKDLPVYVYCARGGRSTEAAEVLKKLGFTEIYNLSGGITAWGDSGYEVNKPVKK